MTSLPADVSDNLNGRQSVVNVIENLHFTRIYWEIILSTYNKVCFFLSTIIELLGSLRFYKLLDSNFSSSATPEDSHILVAPGVGFSLLCLARGRGLKSK